MLVSVFVGMCAGLQQWRIDPDDVSADGMCICGGASHCSVLFHRQYNLYVPEKAFRCLADSFCLSSSIGSQQFSFVLTGYIRFVYASIECVDF